MKPSELREKFLVVVPTSGGFEHLHEVICVRPEYGSFRVALRGYRTVNCTPDMIIECIIGEW